MDPSDHRSDPNIHSEHPMLRRHPDQYQRAKSAAVGHHSRHSQHSHHRRAGSSPYYSPHQSPHYTPHGHRVKSLSATSKSGSKYNPVRISSTTYIGDHHPKGVQFHGGSFTWRMNHDPRRYNKQKNSNQTTALKRNKSADIPGYSQYLERHSAALPFCCWFLLCCGLCIPCCCWCCDWDNDTTNGQIVDDTKPLLTQKGVANNNDNNDAIIVEPVNKPGNVIYIQNQPNMKPISNVAYPSYNSMKNGQSINEQNEGGVDHVSNFNND